MVASFLFDGHDFTDVCFAVVSPILSPHSGLRKDFRPEMGRKSATLSVGTHLCPYRIAYRRAYGLSFRWTVLKNLRRPLCGMQFIQ
jgi:hypothetical protein